MANLAEDQVGQVTGILDQEAIPQDQQGYCMTWGQHHYRTFDGRIYRFTGQCSYILAADAVADAFSIHLHNDGACDGSSDCVRTVTVYAGGHSVVLSHDENGKPMATSSGSLLHLPTNVGSLRIKKAADYIIVREPMQNLHVKWDGKESVFVKVYDDMSGGVVGLC